MGKFYAMTEKELFEELGTSAEGLSAIEVTSRLKKYGPNELPKKKRESIWRIIMREVMDPIVLLLVVAIVASLFVGEVVDAVAIFVIILIDLIMGTYQENKANKTMESLANLVEEKVKVIRGGVETQIRSSLVTVGDVVLLESGDKIAADMRIIEAHNFTVDESALTGESVAIEKKAKKLDGANLPIHEQKNIVFAGTAVITGRAKAVVYGVGLETEIGEIATVLAETKDEKSPLTIRVEKFSKQITGLIVAIAVIIAIILAIKGENLNVILISVIALAVSAMPEGLPLAMTMALTIGSSRMAKQRIVVKGLNTVESLGSSTVIASDKTGTLTINEQTAKVIVTPDGTRYEIDELTRIPDGLRELALLGAVNNEASIRGKERIGDSIDLAFLNLGKKFKVDLSGVEVVERIPYESQNKYSAVFYKEKGEVYCTVKGSPEKVMEFCNKNSRRSDSKALLAREKAEELSEGGFRVIALARGKISTKTGKNTADIYTEKDILGLELAGLVGFVDPIRKGAPEAIKKCRQAGIKVMMITGDHPLTAYKIAQDLGLTDSLAEVATGEEVEEYLRRGEAEFDDFIKGRIVYARVTPIQKLKIVESLKRQGEYVAVTGDGVNDAPALKTANIGVAMGSGADVARESADMVVLDDDFSSIVRGVLEGRVAYANIRKITYFLISCGLAEVLFFIFAIVAGLPMPLVAIQLLWLNVVTDGIQDFALSFERPEKDIMKEGPHKAGEGLFNRLLIQEVAVAGVTIGLIVFLVWVFLIKTGMETTEARAYIMALMVVIQNVHAFNCRSETKSSFTIPLKSNKIFIWGVAGSVVLGIVMLEAPLFNGFLKTTSIPFLQLIAITGIGCLILPIMEIYKKIKS